MKGARHEVYVKTNSIKNLIQQVEHVKDVLPRPDDIVRQFKECLALLERKSKELPIGHRYEGEYYIKKPGMTYPPEFEKRCGVLFMRENQVSWFEDKEDRHFDKGYLRSVYKEPDLNKRLYREDGIAVFEASRQGSLFSSEQEESATFSSPL